MWGGGVLTTESLGAPMEDDPLMGAHAGVLGGHEAAHFHAGLVTGVGMLEAATHVHEAEILVEGGALVRPTLTEHQRRVDEEVAH